MKKKFQVLGKYTVGHLYAAANVLTVSLLSKMFEILNDSQ